MILVQRAGPEHGVDDSWHLVDRGDGRALLATADRERIAIAMELAAPDPRGAMTESLTCSGYLSEGNPREAGMTVPETIKVGP